MNNRLLLTPILPLLALSSFVLSSPLPGAEPLPSQTPAGSPSAGAPLTEPLPAAPGEISGYPSLNPQGTIPGTYVVKSGDSLWDIAHKFHTTVTKLKKLNGLKTTHLKPGQVIKVPSVKGAKPPAKSARLTPKKSTEMASHSTHRAQPVQDFDLPASTFASCPVPEPSDSTTEPVPAPLAQQTPATEAPSPELAADEPMATPVAPSHVAEVPASAPLPISRRAPEILRTPEYSTTASAVPVQQPAHHGLFNFFYTPQPATDWGARFIQVARDLGNRNIEYNEDWCPPGESHSWSMDCSNTTRYLFKVTTGIQLPRTASDQYYYLHLQNKAWDVPQTASGFADCNYLRQNLKPGDLLFWENTYKPERQPPITHVMVFLGTNERGNWIMAGSQSSRGGEHNRRHGGPDIYIFDPTKPCGGYTTWLGLVHHQGRFCAYGRPLEADKAKLAVAAND